MSNNKITKALIELSLSADEADQVIVGKLGSDSTAQERLAFLKGMFDVEIIDGSDDALADYRVVLETIVNNKWRN